MSETFKNNNPGLRSKIAIGLMVGTGLLTGCGGGEHDSETKEQLSGLLKPQMDKLGRVAVCLGDSNNAFVNIFEEKDGKMILATGLHTSMGSDEFRIEMGSSDNSPVPDDVRTLEIESTEARKGNVPDQTHVLILKAPDSTENPSGDSYYGWVYDGPDVDTVNGGYYSTSVKNYSQYGDDPDINSDFFTNNASLIASETDDAADIMRRAAGAPKDC